MCKCGHTAEQHKVNTFERLTHPYRNYFGNLYTSYCKVTGCKCEIYNPEK